MFGKRIELFKVFGIPIRLDWSWLLIFVLVAWTLASGLFPHQFGGLSRATYWIMGVLGALGLFASVVLHELGHALIAQRCGVPMKGITLFIFGGVAEMGAEPPSARAEFKVAIAGPIVSLALAVIFILAGMAGSALGVPTPIHGVIGYLGVINGLLVAFNMIPAFPLDGGRVLRSALWAWRKDLRRASQIASQIGAGFGLALIVLGIFGLVSGNFIGGFWWILIGMFLRHAAQMSYQQVIVRRLLEGEPVRRFMHPDPITVSPDTNVAEFVEDYVYRHHHKLFPVTENGSIEGCVSTRKVKELPRDRWDETSVRDIADACTERNTISADDDAMTAFSRLHRNDTSRLIVLDGDKLVGMLTLKDLLQFVALKVELEEGDGTTENLALQLEARQR